MNPTQVGDHIGSYLLTKQIGKGGMAMIFEAKHLTRQKNYAIKIMLPTQKQEEVSHRFHQEYKALSRLKHPNVLRVLESGIHEEKPYFVMELLEGKILKEEISTWDDLSPTERFKKTRSILTELAQALDYIHQLGWVHRDITPGNIMIQPDGSIKLMDFGIVKIPGNELTAVGEMIGTVAYMSPEQIKGEQVDARADLYSLGTCLYFMLTGKRPFSARTLPGYLDKHLNHKPTPPQHHTPMVPQDLAFACMRLLEKDPDARFCSANHLLCYLETIEQSSTNRLVGRTWELSQLRDDIAHLEETKGGLVIIEGSYGMGCTSLLKEASRLCKKAGYLSIYTNNQSRKQAAFYGVRTLFRRLGPAIQKDSPINQIFDVDRTFEKWTVFAAIRDMIEKSQIRLIAIDNIDNSDMGTIELTEYLIRNLSQKIIFILSVHDTFFEPIQGILSSEETDITPKTMVLAPISVAAIEEWLLLWFSHDESILPLAMQLHNKSGGNPTLVHEMIRDLRIKKRKENKRIPLNMTPHEIEQAQFALPKDLKEATLIRLSKLSPAAKHILSFVSAYQGRLPHNLLLEAITQYTKLRLSSEEIITSLLTLQDLKVIEVFKELKDNLYGMEHNWMRDIVKNHILASEPYHIALGKALEIQYIATPGPILEDLAYHFENGRRYGKAYAYLFQAAQKLRKRTLVEEAEQYLSRAFEIEPIAREHLTLFQAEFRRTELLLERGIVYNILSEKMQAKQQIALAQDNAQKIKSAELLARIFTEKSHHLRETYNLEEAQSVLEKALEEAQSAGLPKLEIVPYYESGAIQWEKGDFAGAQQYFRKAQELAEHLNHAEGSALSNNGLGVLSMCQGQSADARRYFEQAIRVGKENGMVESLVNARTNLAELHHCMGNFRKGLSLANEAINECREVSHRQGLGIALRYRANLLCDLDQLIESKENSKTAIKIQRNLQNPTEEFASLISLLRVLMISDPDQELHIHLKRAEELHSSYDAEGNTPLLNAWKALIAHRNNEHNKAIDLLTEIDLEQGRSWIHQKARCHLEIARVWDHLGEREKAEYSAAQALNISDNSGYRFYSLQARIILSKTLLSTTKKDRHARIARSLCKSLSANLSSTDAQRFLTRHS